jgi:hypothetical protein
VAIQPAGHQITWDKFKLAFREHYIPEGVLHMKQEEFMKLKQGGDTVTQYLNKFNHLSQYAIDQVNTDLKKKNCFMRGLNDRLQRKMATYLDLSYSRAVSTALAVEAKYAGPGKSKGYGGDRPNQGPEKRQRLVIRPFNQTRSSSRPPSYPFKQPVFIRPATAPTSTNQPSAPGTRFPTLPNSSTGCFNCGKSGHFIKDCPYLKQNRSNNQQSSGSSAQCKGNAANNTACKNMKKTGWIYYTQVAMTPEGEPVMMGTYLRIVLTRLREHHLYAKFSKCAFCWRRSNFWDIYYLLRGLVWIPAKSRIFWSGNPQPLYIKSEVSLDWLVITADLFRIFPSS